MRFCRERDGRGGSPSICRNLSPTSAVIARMWIWSSSSRSFCIFANSQLRKSFEGPQRRRPSDDGSVSCRANSRRRQFDAGARRRSIRQIHLQTAIRLWEHNKNIDCSVADPQSAAHFHPAEPGMRCAKPGKPQASPHKKEPPGTFPSGSRQMAVSGSAPSRPFFCGRNGS
jgi:hypothetical protein